MEQTEAIAFMVFGLGFFLYVIWFISHSDDVEYNRRLNERREFGAPLPKPKKKRMFHKSKID